MNEMLSQACISIGENVYHENGVQHGFMSGMSGCLRGPIQGG